ncbi:hypothetical protein M569_01091, partial [Genlisea aurea]
ENGCPPGGEDTLVLYTTSIRGIRKTHEDCNRIRVLFDSFKVAYAERDVSMHMEYRDELWKVLGGRHAPPRVFLRGRYIGGAEEVLSLHEKGTLKALLSGIPTTRTNYPCKGCAGIRFLVCGRCHGRRKVTAGDCFECNENGLVKCSVC